MSKYWTTASAMLPRGGGWEIRGVVKGPREADPVIHGSTWTAWAAGDRQRVEGHGDTAEDAMQDLANQLRATRPDPDAQFLSPREIDPAEVEGRRASRWGDTRLTIKWKTNGEQRGPRADIS